MSTVSRVSNSGVSVELIPTDNAFAQTWDTMAEAWLSIGNVTMFTNVPVGTYELKLRLGSDNAGPHVVARLTFNGVEFGNLSFGFSSWGSSLGADYREFTLYFTADSIGPLTIRAGVTTTILRPTASIRRIQ